jgi:HAD superfamily hydrolase (TIGR01509 family)
MASRFRALFFDAGNTLIFPRLDEAAQKLTGHGYPAMVEDFHAAERSGKARLDEWLWPQIRDGEVPRRIDHYYWGEYLSALMDRVKAPKSERGELMLWVSEIFKDITLWSRVLPDSSPALERLRKRGFSLGVISNSIGTMEEQLERLGLGQHFDTVIDSAIVGVEKPHPEIFQIALDRAGVAASEALFVGDTYSVDVGGAGLAGLTGALMDRVGAYPDADCLRVQSLSELDAVLEK